jgi:hypothetical protein
MRVFISWSGPRSKLLAEAISNWLPLVLNAVRPYFSPDDVAKGDRWSSQLSAELEASSFGLLCLTPDNTMAPWIVFEAGALSKSLTGARVCPLLFGIEPTDVTGPLAQFQATRFEEAEMARLIKDLNKQLGESGVASHMLDRIFAQWWPELRAHVRDIEARVAAAAAPPRELRSMVEEVLALNRRTAQSLEKLGGVRKVPSPIIEDLLRGWRNLLVTVGPIGDDRARESLRRLHRPMEALLRRICNSSDYATFVETSRLLKVGPHSPSASQSETVVGRESAGNAHQEPMNAAAPNVSPDDRP